MRKRETEVERHNIFLRKDVSEYMRIMSRAAGMTMTEFANVVIYNHMKEHKRQYDTIRKRQDGIKNPNS